MKAARGWILIWAVFARLTFVHAATEPAEARSDEAAADDEIVSLATYNVKADRIEDFGFRVSDPIVTFVAIVPRPEAPYVTAVLPNTAASKAGLRPGDRIVKSDGRSAAMTIFTASKWSKLIRAKNAEVASGKKVVTWTLEVQPRGTKTTRTITLALPTRPPHWGAAVWHAPEGRAASVVSEPGPLAELCRAVLDHGVCTWIDEPFAGVVGAGRPPRPPGFDEGFEWRLGGRREGLHRILVTQAAGRTDVFFDLSSPEIGRRVYLTSPSGVLAKAWRFTRKKKGEIPLEEAREGFAHELALWTTKVGRFSARWPLEVMPGYDPNTIFAVLAAQEGLQTKTTERQTPEAFARLPAATDAQQAVFAEAYSKLGTEPDRWAYTETSRGLEDRRVAVTRVDYSKPDAERVMLLSIDGKTPTPDDVQHWRDAGGDTPKPLGELPPLASVCDLRELRVFAEEAEAVTFELPIQSENPEFPAGKFQALFRVNRDRRAFESITVKLRENVRVGGLVKVTDAGLEMRFQTIDPALPPQPVFLRAGGGVSVLLVRFSRAFEATRTDFQRVEPFGPTD